MTQVSQPPYDEASVARVPRGFVFPLKPLGPVKAEVKTLAGEEYTLLIGGVAPLGGSDNLKRPGLTMAHARLIYRILYGRGFDSPTIPISFNNLIRKGSVQSGPAYANVRKLVNELADSWVHVVRPGKRTEAVRLVNFDAEIGYRKGVHGADIDAVSREENIEQRVLKNVVFATEFWRACLNYQECWAVRVDSLDSMTSELAAFGYLTLAPKTFNKEVPAGKRMRIDAAGLLAKAGAKFARLGEIARLFERQRGESRSVLQQMDGQAMWDGVFRVAPKLELNADESGYNIVYWREVPSREAIEEQGRKLGALYDAWVRVTHRQRGFFEAAKPEWALLEPHNIEAMESLGYNWEPHQKFLERVRSFIGPARFDTVLGSVKMKLGDADAGSSEAIRDLGRYVGGALIAEFEAWAKKYDESLRS